MKNSVEATEFLRKASVSTNQHLLKICFLKEDGNKARWDLPSALPDVAMWSHTIAVRKGENWPSGQVGCGLGSVGPDKHLSSPLWFVPLL